MYDAIVIGARCAGSVTAMLLAQKGYQVLLVDRATFPSEIPHGHFIHRHGPKRLQRWGLLDKIVATNCPPIRSSTTDLGDFPLTGTEVELDGVAWGYGPRRKALDKALIDAAVEAGVELREGFGVEGFLTEGDRINGIRGRSNATRRVVEERARVTIGADGRNSMLARTVQAPTYHTMPTILCYYFSYWADVPNAEFELYLREEQRRVIFSFRTNDDLYSIFIGWPIEEFPRVRSDIKGNFMEALNLVPDLAERTHSGQQVERFYGVADLPNFLRKPYGPGWALVGDAGSHKDPYLALGLCDAFRDAELLAESLDEGLAGRQPLDQALADYEKKRNEMTLPDYQMNLDRAQFKPLPPEVYHLRLALQGNQEDTRRFIMANEGMIPREEFFNPQNLGQIMSKAGGPHA